MDLAFVMPRIATVGGAEKYLNNVVRELVKKHEVTIYTLDFNQNNFTDLKELVKVIKIPKYLLMKGKMSTLIDVLLVSKMGKRIPDTHEVYNPHLFPTNFVNKKPNVWTCQEPSRMLYDLWQETINQLNFWQRPIARIYFPLLCKLDQQKTEQNIQGVIANSEYSKNYIQNIYPRKKISVVYPGVDESLLRITNKPEKILLSVGRLYGIKRVDLIIKSFLKVLEKHSEYKLIIVGTGPEETRLKRLVKELRLEGKVIFVGEITEKKLQEYYRRAKLTIYLPLREMYGMVPMESLATGTPVVGVNEGGFTELVKGVTKLTRPTTESISKAIIDYLETDIAYRKASVRGKKIARQHTWKYTAKKTEKLFKKAINYVKY